jgi:hypothetical protein
MKNRHECLLIRIIRDDEGFHVETVTHRDEKRFMVADPEVVLLNLAKEFADIESAFEDSEGAEEEAQINTFHVGQA